MKLTVIGIPQPQGNKTPMRNQHTGKIALLEGSSPEARVRFKDWRSAIAACARLWCTQNGMPAPIDGPVSLTVTFFMPRPKSAPKRVVMPATKPDLDKLVRACGDALAGIAFTEDSRIVEIQARKLFAIESPPRAEIEVKAFEAAA